ncbi:MAG: membrane integrity-associated transporter subunit PqiC [Candidatus Hydrogenedentes bacterium]|nr:membrane integrity-associated transporter subunit PqiC [Candidatus Hydrogenedentota bacterium]
MRIFTLSLGLCLLFLSGCISTPPPHYFTLNMNPSGRAHPVVNFDIESVEVAEALQREAILIMASPTTVEYYASEQWVAGLDELIPRKLATEWSPKYEDRPTFGMILSIFSFEQIDTETGAHARVSIGVTIRQPRQSRYSEPLFEKTYTSAKPTKNDTVNAVVEALSLCLEDIAYEIATDSRTLILNKSP